MMFCDAPYNVPIDGHASGLGAVKHADFVQGSGELSPAEFQSFLRTERWQRLTGRTAVHAETGKPFQRSDEILDRPQRGRL
jgi:hypothetical protein